MGCGVWMRFAGKNSHGLLEKYMLGTSVCLSYFSHLPFQIFAPPSSVTQITQFTMVRRLCFWNSPLCTFTRKALEIHFYHLNTLLTHIFGVPRFISDHFFLPILKLFVIFNALETSPFRKISNWFGFCKNLVRNKDTTKDIDISILQSELEYN